MYFSDEQIKYALSSIIKDLDYDLHKELEQDKSGGDGVINWYPGLVFDFKTYANEFES